MREGFLTTSGEGNDEIKVLNNQKFIKVTNKKATQIRFSKSTQEGIHSSANGSSSQNHH